MAQTYPARPVRIIVGFPPGGAADIVARLMAQWLSERLGQPFVIENKPGAATNIGTDSVVHSTPDGYTLLFVTTSAAINATLYENLTFNFIRDIVPVAGISQFPLVMRSISLFQLTRFPSLLPMPSPIRPKSTWRRAASGAGSILPANYSRWSLASTWFTCRIVARHLR
jgi:tripartite-type tricarboxylate transporter receptor subunit TctC